MISITLKTPGTDMPEYVLARMEPPAVLLGEACRQMGTGHPGPDRQAYWQDVLDRQWRRWRQESPAPEHDGEFVEWLEVQGWTRLEDDLQVTLAV